MRTPHKYLHEKDGRPGASVISPGFMGQNQVFTVPAACFNLQERLVPYVRALTARQLSERGLRQERIAEHLGVSQAMVSKYLRKPPRPAPGVPEATIQRLVGDAVAEAVEQEDRGAIGAYCPTCTALSANGFCVAQTPVEEVEQCLRHDRPAARREQEAVLQVLRNAEAGIRRGDLTPLMPAVRMNLAMGLKQARDARDVAAFPGRLVQLKGKVSAVHGPEFGSSSHLADLLVKIQKRRPAIRSILNVRWDDDVARAADAAELTIHELKRQGTELVAVVPEKGGLDGLVDPGGFGIEPNLYLVGPDAERVVADAIKLRKRIPETDPKVSA